MKKYILIGIFLLAAKSDGLSQKDKRLKIDSLKKILPSLKDTARIDCLNALSQGYIGVKTDSAKLYGLQALKEANNINYTYGQGKAYFRIALSLWVSGMEFPAMERYSNMAIIHFKKYPNDQQLGVAYRDLGYSKWAQSSFPEAIDAMQTCLQLYIKAGDTADIGSIYNILGAIEAERGYYGNALQYLLKGIGFNQESNYGDLGLLYMLVGDFDTALEYLRKSLVTSKYANLSIGEVFFNEKKYDSALHYYRQFQQYATTSGYNDICKGYARRGELYLVLHQYDSALIYLQNALYPFKKANDRNQVMWVLLRLGRAYKEMGHFMTALHVANRLLQTAQETGARQSIRDAHFLLYELFEALGQYSKALIHLHSYMVVKDSIDKDLSVQKLSFYKTQTERAKAQSSIAMLNKERKLQQQELKQTAIQKNVLLGGVISLLVFGAVLFGNIVLKRRNEKHLRELAENELQIQKLESEKTKIEFQHRSAELEMQALRAQMNPHFIFNCLSSINRFILKNESEAASDYLTKFSRLIRMVLTHSKQSLISLDDELEMLRLYLEMERLRFKYSFDYNINFKNAVNPENIFIPPLLLQPFAENAIWHGMMNKEGQGHLTISLSQENNELSCIIEDNGVGRAKAAELKSKSAEKKKSLGLQITKERLALLNKDSNETTFFEVKDMYDTEGNANGTMVILKIKLHDRFEEHSVIS